MSTVISVENLGKKYTLHHQQREPYTALRDVITNGVASFGKKLLSPFTIHSSPFPTSQEDFWALNDVSFEVKQGDRIGIIGRNGAGKSTLLKVLSRITEPTTGRVKIKGRVASLLEVGTGFHPELTGRENIYLNGAILGMSRAEIRKKFDEIVDFAEIEKFLDTPVKRYSSGMYVRLAFAVAAHLDPEILVVDEVLAVGDAQFQKKCLGKMEDVSAKEGRTVLFVSHNMGAVRQFCNKGLFLHTGQMLYEGEVVDAIDKYESSVLKVQADSNLCPGVIYNNSITVYDHYDIVEASLYTDKGVPCNQVNTFDDFVIKLIFFSPEEKSNGSVGIFINTLGNSTLLRCAMRPDAGFDMAFKKGLNRVTCNIRQLPLPAGTYLLSAGLSDPPREWFCEKELCIFEVGMKDIHRSGFPPQEKHTLVVANYTWKII